MLAVSENGKATRTVPLTISGDRMSISGDVSVESGSVTYQAIAYKSSGPAVYASLQRTVTLENGASHSAVLVLMCLDVDCDDAGGGGGTPGVGSIGVTLLTPQPEVESNNTSATATPIGEVSAPDGFYSAGHGRIASTSDVDFFAVGLFAGETNTVYTISNSLTDALNPTITVFDPSGAATSWSNNDCGGGVTESCLVFTVTTTGTYRIRVSGASSTTGRYTLVVQKQ